MDEPRTRISYTPHAGDATWSDAWTPVTDKGVPTAWDDLGENEFLYEDFWVDVTLVVGQVDFSRHYLPVLDFALAWASAPIVLREQDTIELFSSVEALVYKVERRGAMVTVRSNVHEGEGEIPWADLENLVDDMIERAFTILYSHHPELRTNPYLLGLRERLAQLHGR